jgi:hypothetical protein
MDTFKLSPDTILAYSLPEEWLKGSSLGAAYEVIVKFSGSNEAFLNWCIENDLEVEILLGGYAILKPNSIQLDLITANPAVIYIEVVGYFEEV